MLYGYDGLKGPAGVPASVVAGEVQRIIDRDGGAEPRVIVEESRPDEAPLHPVFEWRDEVAAEKYREEQARRVVRAVRLVPQPEKHEQGPVVRAFVSVSKPGADTPQARHYRPVLDVLQEPEAASELKTRMLRELLAMRQRYLAVIEQDELLQRAFDSALVAAR